MAIYTKVKVGVLQATPVLFDIQKTVEKVIEWIQKAKAENCKLLLFPEAFIPAYPRGLSYDAVVGKRTERGRELWLDYWNNSIEESSSYVKLIQEAVKEAGIFVALGGHGTQVVRINNTYYVAAGCAHRGGSPKLNDIEVISLDDKN